MQDDYLAGLFDGEGCIAVRWYKRRYATTSVSLSIAMTDRVPVEMFGERFGGQCRPLARRTKGGKIVYKWEQSGTTAERALRVLAAHCVAKKPQLLLALQVISSLKWGNRSLRVSPEENLRRKSIAEQIRILKHT